MQKGEPLRRPGRPRLFTVSLLPAFKGHDEWTITGFSNVVNYGANKLRFISPVPAGAKVHARSRLVAVEPRPMGVMVTRETEVSVVGSEKPALIYEGLALFVR